MNELLPLLVALAGGGLPTGLAGLYAARANARNAGSLLLAAFGLATAPTRWTL